MTAARGLRVLLVDPSLFTAPYDAALTEGLLTAGVDPTWAVRPTRRGDRQELALQYVDAFFYRRVDQLTRLPRALRATVKGFAHALGLVQLIRRVMTRKPDVVHFQWAVVPPLDALALLILRRQCPVVLTVHDTVPFNGEHLSFWQNFAFDLPIKLSDRVIVHTQAGRDTLIRRGVPAAKLAVIPHGPLRLHAPQSLQAPASPADDRFTFVLFGEIKPYKGVDLLVEALGLLPDSARARARVIVAGRPRMDIAPLCARIGELGLAPLIEVVARRLSEEEMASLFARAHCFLFPYRQVDASGVYSLVKPLQKWIIASKVGIFAEDLEEGVHGALVPPNDPRALADAIGRAIAERITPAAAPSKSEWTAIGSATRDVYLQTQKKPTITRRVFGLTAPVSVAVACLPRWLSVQPVEPALPAAPLGLTPDCGYKLVKNWDFAMVIRDEAALRGAFFTRYVYEGGSLDHLNDEWSRYRDNHNHIFTPTGLSLVARVAGGLARGEVESGMLRSRWSGQYGVFEIRMKVPRARGMWPAFWLNPQDQRWPPEIDVVEIVNNGRDTTRHSFHFLHGEGVDGRKPALSKLGANHAYTPGLDYADAFHVFSAEWSAERVRHFVDGTLIADREYRWKHDDGAEAGAAHVLVNLGVGGKWPGPPAAATSFPASLDIDYIRVWQR